jgi:hypothetical protein
LSPTRLLAAAALVALLAACNRDTPEEGEATGEVLEGTISDDMLPLDQVQSEAPLADPSGPGSRSTATAGNVEEEPEAPSEEPAEEPAEAAE